ncbi:MAG: hypothetical protein QOE64_1229 [Frankiales bacterium]|nr:hypothetical protein [Frankiales bacterium]
MLRQVRRGAVTVAGFGLVGVGGVFLLLPGPGLLIIVAGLAVLATEYVWARNALDSARSRAEQAAAASVKTPVRTAGTVLMGLAIIAAGILLIVVDQLPLAGFVTGSFVLLSGVVVLTTTYLQWRNAKTLADGRVAVDERLDL